MKKTSEGRKEKKPRKSQKEDKSKSTANDKVRTNSKSKDNILNHTRFVPKRAVFPNLPSLRDVKSYDVDKVVKEKLIASCIVFNFQNDSLFAEKEEKKQTLIEISDYLNTLSESIPDFLYPDIPELFGCNVFRVFAPFNQVFSVGIEEEEDYQLVDSWPHIQIIYEIFLTFLEKPEWDVKKSKKYIDQTFIRYLLEIFDSPDPRERDYLKTILHRIYGRLIHLRSFIRKQINQIFFTFIYETERHNGIAELLEILGSIINGFQIPVKDEHKVFLTKVLLPLHKMKSLTQYHPQLAYCVTEFIKKDITLIRFIVLDGLIKFWPKMQSFKELMFLNELEECLELCDKTQFEIMLKPLVLQLSRCVSSPNFQVCERTLYFWTNAEIVDLMTPYITQILPLIFPSLYTSKHHWNKQIHSMVFNALKVIMDMNPSAFDDYTNRFKEERNKETENIKNQTESWNRVMVKAKLNPLYKKYTDSMNLSSIKSMGSIDDDNKNYKNIGAEIQRNMTESDAIVKKINIPRSQSTVSLKSSDIKVNTKESYSFKN